MPKGLGVRKFTGTISAISTRSGSSSSFQGLSFRDEMTRQDYGIRFQGGDPLKAAEEHPELVGHRVEITGRRIPDRPGIVVKSYKILDAIPEAS